MKGQSLLPLLKRDQMPLGTPLVRARPRKPSCCEPRMKLLYLLLNQPMILHGIPGKLSILLSPHCHLTGPNIGQVDFMAVAFLHDPCTPDPVRLAN